MKFVSPLLKRVLYPALQRATLLHRWPTAGQLAVVTYHGVLPRGYRVTDPLLDGGWVTPEVFRDQLRLLRSRYNVVSPEHVRRWSLNEEPLPARAVLLTCDDGLANAAAEMLPILQEEKLPCLFFVTSESLSEAGAMLWYEELYLTLLAIPTGELKGQFLNVPVTASVADRIDQRHRLWWDLVSDLSSREVAARVGLAQAILHNPDVLILDEPTAGLDPKQIIETRELIKGLGGEHTIVLSTHILPEVSMTCGRVVIINKGRVVAEDTPENLTHRLQGAATVRLEVRGESPDLEATLAGVSGVKSVRRAKPGVYEVDAEAGRDVRADLARAVVGRGLDLLSLQQSGMSLEEIFLHLTTTDVAAEAAVPSTAEAATTPAEVRS